jgi:peptidoglycan/xylan/chitin deacetylase (PgdA/CDA1 family)
MKYLFLFFIFMFFHEISWSQTKEICITLDDLPVVSYDFKEIKFQQTIVKKLIKTFDTYQIPAIGFVNENKLYTKGELDIEKVNLLKMWLKAGYELGNHTYSHKDYHKVSYDEFTQDVLDGEKVCKQLVQDFDQEYRYFRHPYLHVGLNKDKHDSLKVFLNMHNYKEAPVSIDNDDYLFAYAYSKAMLREDKDLMKKIGKDYVDYMEDKLLFFEGQSEKLLGRNIKHILLLHANAINADYLDELAGRYKSHGYVFVSMKEALTDVAYQTEITKYNNWGISWLDRWALSQGKKGDFFEGDPVTPEYVKAFLKQK